MELVPARQIDRSSLNSGVTVVQTVNSLASYAVNNCMRIMALISGPSEVEQREGQSEGSPHPSSVDGVHRAGHSPLPDGSFSRVSFTHEAAVLSVLREFLILAAFRFLPLSPPFLLAEEYITNDAKGTPYDPLDKDSEKLRTLGRWCLEQALE